MPSPICRSSTKRVRRTGNSCGYSLFWRCLFLWEGAPPILKQVALSPARPVHVLCPRNVPSQRSFLPHMASMTVRSFRLNILQTNREKHCHGPRLIPEFLSLNADIFGCQIEALNSRYSSSALLRHCIALIWPLVPPNRYLAGAVPSAPAGEKDPLGVTE